ncbi:HAMP domain-containing protein [Mycobacterium sp. KBS0706]|uniref:sensor histidine kinase n=1 Tax=Mycobacterium sp. KBS0706 TaxID=2578109 RepID=UPI00110F7B25|nr:ATP-binding protein [Mycobacterium sp. KBS0706]TSD90036.1 HAMP domain-containing protein [Mycobacterium sp. KBS0706]
MRTRILRTTSFRLTALYTVVFGASVAVILGILYWATEGYTERQFDATLTTVVTELTEDYPNDPPEEIASDIEQSLAQDPLGPGFYLFEDRDGRRLAGNLPAMAPGPGPVDLTLPGGGKDGGEVRLRGMGKILVDGAFVLVAADRAPIDDLQELWLRGLGWGLLATAVLGVGGGLVVSAGVLRRVDAINRICLKIMEGDLSQRLPGRGTDDEFDRLTGVVNAMLDRIEALLEGLRQVSTDIAHDLRTPLGRLRQQLEGALLRSGTAAEYERSVERAMAEADRLLGIFNALLRIAQVEAGSRRRGFARVDLSALVGTVAEIFQASAEEQGRAIRSRIEPEVAVTGDADLLSQAVANLIENALRHTPAGTGIDIALSRLRDGRAELVVADRGPGVPAEERERVFRRFYRLEQSRHTPGNGLGLSLVAATAQLHRAEVSLGDNHPGLRVTVLLP